MLVSVTLVSVFGVAASYLHESATDEGNLEKFLPT